MKFEFILYDRNERELNSPEETPDCTLGDAVKYIYEFIEKQHNNATPGHVVIWKATGDQVMDVPWWVFCCMYVWQK